MHLRAATDRLTARLALVGAAADDDEDLRARKALLVLISVMILPVAALWGPVCTSRSDRRLASSR